MDGQKIKKLMPLHASLPWIFLTLKMSLLDLVNVLYIIHIMSNKDFYQRVLMAQYVAYLYKFSILPKYDGL